MLYQALSLLLLLLLLLLLQIPSATPSGFLIAERIPQPLDNRAATSGGWSLALSICPANSQLQLCHYSFCCPDSLSCVISGFGNRCCPAGTDCLAAYQASPQCADDSWSLWNVTAKGPGYFCCLPGQIGTNDWTCVAGNTPVVATLSAQLVSAATGVAATAAATVSSTAAATSSTAASSQAVSPTGGSTTSLNSSSSSTSSKSASASMTSSSSSPTSSLVIETSKSEAMGSAVMGQSLFYCVSVGLICALF